MATATVYGIKQGTRWLTKLVRSDGGAWWLKFRPLSESRYLYGLESQAKRDAADMGGVVVPVTLHA